MRRRYKLELLWRGGQWKYSASYAKPRNAVKVGKLAMNRLADVLNWRVIDTETGEDVSSSDWSRVDG